MLGSVVVDLAGVSACTTIVAGVGGSVWIAVEAWASSVDLVSSTVDRSMTSSGVTVIASA